MNFSGPEKYETHIKITYLKPQRNLHFNTLKVQLSPCKSHSQSRTIPIMLVFILTLLRHMWCGI
jgi:hypothetical protein